MLIDLVLALMIPLALLLLGVVVLIRADGRLPARLRPLLQGPSGRWTAVGWGLLIGLSLLRWLLQG
ncbi:MAG: hypothetical protein VKI63_09395 [Cyanobium sp.]|nr:hypothetical protein [Cyanobium sp.]